MLGRTKLESLAQKQLFVRSGGDKWCPNGLERATFLRKRHEIYLEESDFEFFLGFHLFSLGQYPPSRVFTSAVLGSGLWETCLGNGVLAREFSNVTLCVVKGIVMERTTSEKPPFNPVEGRSGSSSLMALKAAIEVDNHPQPPLKHPRRWPCEPSVFRAENVQNQPKNRLTLSSASLLKDQYRLPFTMSLFRFGST